MKNKVKKCFVLLITIVLVLGILTVKAYDPIDPVVDPFEYGWETNPQSIFSIDNIDIENQKFDAKITIADNNYEFHDGYVASEIYYTYINKETKFYSNLTSYDKEGNVLKKQELINEVIFTMKSEGENLYAITLFTNPEGKSPIFYIKKYDSNLNVKNSIDITSSIIPAENENINNFIYTLLETILPKLIGYDSLSIQDGKIIMFAGTEELLVVDKDFKTISFLPLDEESVKIYYPNIAKEVELISGYLKKIEEETDISEIYISTDQNERYRVSSGITYKREAELDLNHGLVLPQDLVQAAIEEITEEAEQSTTAKEEDKITPYEDYLVYDGKIGLYNQNDELIWETINRDYVLLFDTHIIGNYIVTIGANLDAPTGLYDGSSFFEIIDDELGLTDKRFHELLSEFVSEFGINTDILIYDMKGNLVQKISDGSIYLELFPSESGFITNSIQGIPQFISLYKTIVDNYYEDIEKIVNDVRVYYESDTANTDEKFELEIPEKFKSFGLNLLKEFPIKTNHEVWHVVSKVNVVIEGKGSISAPPTSVMGEEVLFTVTPNEGHVLEAVHVKDMEGNELLVTTENTFTMPSQDVIIEAQFKKVYNPKTSALTIASVLATMVGVIIFISINKKKLKWLR